MRKVLLGTLLVPVLAGGVVRGVRPTRVAHAASARDGVSMAVQRALVGRFFAPATTTAVGERPAIKRRVCRVTAPDLGPQVYYVEESFAAASQPPFSSTLLVVTPLDATHARIDELRPRDHAALVGTCDRSGRPADDTTLLADQGCTLVADVGAHGLVAHTDGATCPSTLNGAQYRERTLTVRDGDLAVLDVGRAADGTLAWGDATAPMRFRRESAAR